MTSEGLGEMFEGDSADTNAGKIPLVPMGVVQKGYFYPKNLELRDGEGW